MNKMQKHILTLAACTLALNASAGIEGWGLGAGVFDGDFGIQGRKDFALGEKKVSEVSLQGSVFNHDKLTFRFDADYHHILNPDSPVRLYPLAGMEFSINKRSNRWGANLGAGMNIKLTEHNDAFLEFKYVFGDWSGFGFMAGIHF